MPTDNMEQLAGSAASQSSFAASVPQELLIRQEQNLGIVREMVPPQEHIGLKLLAPWLEVATDDVVMDYTRGAASGLAPAVAQDSESETYQNTSDYSGQIRASVMDWRLRDEYTASDVMTYREAKALIEGAQGQGGSFPLTTSSVVEGFAARLLRDTGERRKRLDNRIEWLITQAIDYGGIVMNDGKILVNVDYGRPADQHDEAPGSGTYASNTHDPINDAIAVKEFMFQRHGVNVNRLICSRKFAQTLWKSSKFIPRTGFPASANVDPKYVLDQWGPQGAIDIFKREAEIDLIVTDNIYRTKNHTTGAYTNTRFLREDRAIFLPDEGEISAFDNTELGFGKTLTSPHPMGNWQPGFYSWEIEKMDPWAHIVGTGVKAFPVFPHMELTYTWQLTLPS